MYIYVPKYAYTEVASHSGVIIMLLSQNLKTILDAWNQFLKNFWKIPPRNLELILRDIYLIIIQTWYCFNQCKTWYDFAILDVHVLRHNFNSYITTVVEKQCKIYWEPFIRAITTYTYMYIAHILRGVSYRYMYLPIHLHCHSLCFTYTTFVTWYLTNIHVFVCIHKLSITFAKINTGGYWFDKQWCTCMYVYGGIHKPLCTYLNSSHPYPQ